MQFTMATDTWPNRCCVLIFVPVHDRWGCACGAPSTSLSAIGAIGAPALGMPPATACAQQLAALLQRGDVTRAFMWIECLRGFGPGAQQGRVAAPKRRGVVRRAD